MSFSSFILPSVVLCTAGMILISKKDLTKSFLDGCKNGLNTTVSILPSLILLVVGVNMFRASGGIDAVALVFSDVCAFLRIPREIVPVSLMRIISGSGATAMIKSLFETEGADSLAGLSASILLGSSDTIIYTVSMYLSYAKIKKSGYTYPLALFVMMFCTVVSCVIARTFY